MIIVTSDRDGNIGGQLLNRFNLIIDTNNRKFYFKPNSSFKSPFTYNIAGIEVVHTSGFLPQVEVNHVWKDSPAERAGIQVGDIIAEINFKQMNQLNIAEVRHYFQTQSKIPMKMLVERNGSFQEFVLEMRAKI